MRSEPDPSKFDRAADRLRPQASPDDRPTFPPSDRSRVQPCWHRRDHVEPTISCRIGMRLVARIDDGTSDHRIEVNEAFEKSPPAAKFDTPSDWSDSPPRPFLPRVKIGL